MTKRYIPTRKKTETVLTSNVTLVGTPVVRKNVVSQFASSRYAYISSFRPSTYSWEFHFKVRTSINDVEGCILAGDAPYVKPVLGVGQDGWEILISSDGSSWDIADSVVSNTEIETGKIYYLKFGWNSTEYYLEVSEDDETFERVIEVVSSTPIYDSDDITLLGCYDTSAWTGEIDLKGCSLTVWSQIHYYKEITTGSTGDWEQQVLTGYTTSTEYGDITVSATSDYGGNCPAWKIMTGQTSSTVDSGYWQINGSTSTQTLTMTLPIQVTISSLKVTTRPRDNYSGTVTAQIDGVSAGSVNTNAAITEYTIFSGGSYTGSEIKLVVNPGGNNYYGLQNLKIYGTYDTTRTIVVDGTSSDYTYYEFDPTVTWTGTSETQNENEYDCRYIPVHKNSTITRDNVILNGSAQLNDHILSNFTASTSSYGLFYLDHTVLPPRIHNFEINTKFKINNFTNSGRVLFVGNSTADSTMKGIWIDVTQGLGARLNSYNGDTYYNVQLIPSEAIATNTWYWVKAKYKDGICQGMYSTDGKNYLPVENVQYDTNFVGSLTKENYVIRSFSTSNYASAKRQLPASFTEVVYETKFMFTNTSSIMDIISIHKSGWSDGWNIATGSNKKIRLWSKSSGNVYGTTVMNLNTWYYVKVECTSGGCTAYLSTDGETWTEECTQANSDWSYWPSTNIYLGVRYFSSSSRDEAFTYGSMNLKDTKVYVDGDLYWSGAHGVYKKEFPWYNFEETQYKLGSRGDSSTQFNGLIDLTGCDFKVNGDLLWRGTDPDFAVTGITKVGNPNVRRDSISGFMDNNYFTTTNILKRDGTLTVCFLYGDPRKSESVFVNTGFLFIYLSDSSIYTRSASTSQEYSILQNPRKYTKYWVKVKFEGNNQTFSYSTDGKTFYTSAMFTNTTAAAATTYIGKGSSTGMSFVSGCIYLEECNMVDPDGNVIWKPHINYTSDGLNYYLPSIRI